MIDFFADARAFINTPEDSASPSVDYKQTTPKEFKPKPKPEEKPEQKELCLYSGLDISEDGTIITLDGKPYEVPAWYNKEMIKARDKKTIDMVFIHYGIETGHKDLRTLVKG